MLSSIYNKYLNACANVSTQINNFKNSERGVTSVEYAIVVAGVAAVCATIFGSDGNVSQMLSAIFSKVQSRVVDLVGSTTGS